MRQQYTQRTKQHKTVLMEWNVQKKNEKLDAPRFAWFAPFALLGLHIIETCNEGGGDFVILFELVS